MSDESQENFVWMVALMLDHPTLHMGGPSHANRKKANEVYKQLIKDGWTIVAPSVSGRST